LKENQADEEKERDIFFKIIIPNVEQQLEGGKSYLYGYDLSLADIALFNELLNAIEILDQNVDARKYPNVDKWMVRMEDIAPVRKSTIWFQEELKKLK
jgi:glutathione S-transferase